MTGEGIRASGRPPGQLARRWLRVLEGVEERLKGRLRRGKTLARGGRVQSLEVAPGTVYADVQDGSDVHRPILRIRTYDEDEWGQVLSVLGQRLELLAALLEGEVPDDLLTTLQAGGVVLFPRRDELDGDCDCGDYALPCDHGAAVHHVLAEALEGEPLLLFALRGRPREQLITDLRRRWGDTSAAPSRRTQRDEAVPQGDWFASPTPMPPMTFRFHPPARSPGLLELGPLPGDGDVMKTLAPLYDAGADGARELALTELANPESRRRRRPSEPAAGPAAMLPFPAEPPVAVAPAPKPTPKRPPKAQRQAAPMPPQVSQDVREADHGDDGEVDFGERLVDLLAEADDGLSTRKLAQRAGEPRARVLRELNVLEELGLVARSGSGPATRWWLG